MRVRVRGARPGLSTTPTQAGKMVKKTDSEFLKILGKQRVCFKDVVQQPASRETASDLQR